MKSALRISSVTIRELVYERVFYILLCFAALSVGLSLLLGQLTYREQGKLILDFMLAGIQVSMVLFSVFMGISLFQRELHSGSIYMVLSKPVNRSSFLVGKFLGQWVIQMLVIGLMGVVTYLICAAMGGYTESVSLFQAVTLIGFEASVLTALTYLLAVNAGAITSAVVVLCLFGMGHLQDTVNTHLREQDSALTVWRFLKTLIPNLEIFNMKAFASYGMALGWVEFGWAAVYAVLCTVVYLVMAALCFQRKDLT